MKGLVEAHWRVSEGICHDNVFPPQACHPRVTAFPPLTYLHRFERTPPDNFRSPACVTAIVKVPCGREISVYRCL